MKLLISNDILYKQQYGFHPKYSTIHPIIHLLPYCAISMFKPDTELTLAVFCDLSNETNHEILLKKMNNLGIRGITQDCFESYLSDRQQLVEVGGKVSELEFHKGLFLAHCYLNTRRAVLVYGLLISLWEPANPLFVHDKYVTPTGKRLHPGY